MIDGHCYDRVVMPTDDIDLTISGKVKSAPFLSPKLVVSLQMLHGASSAVCTDGASRFDVTFPKCRQQSMAGEEIVKE